MIERRIPPDGDPFTFAGYVEVQEHPCGCLNGVVYIGHLVHDEETGEEVEVIDRVSCRKCSR